MQALWSLLACCSDHTGKKEGSCFPKQSTVGLQLCCSLRLCDLSSPPCKPWECRGAHRHSAFWRWCGVALGKCPSWVVTSRLVNALEDVLVCFSDSEGEGEELGLLLPQKEEGGGQDAETHNGLCSLGKVVVGHFTALSTQQLPNLPVPYNDCRRKCPGPTGKSSKPELTQLI